MIRRIFQALATRSTGSDPLVSFAVKCSSGHVVRGSRQRRHQVVRCPECGDEVFVLPRSPFPEKTPRISPTGKRASTWRGPVVAAALTLLVVAGGLAYLLVSLTRKGEDSPDIQSHLESADAALAEGRLRRAVEEFSKARELALQRPDVLSAAQHRALLQRHREASLVADLLSESLDEILLRAARSPEEEWKAQFEKRYRGPGQANAVIFDAEVRRDAAGSYHVDWDLKPGDEPARLDINDLAVLHDLPLNEPRRLLFGARLGSIAREQNGVWVVRFDPSSGVLLTDPHVVAACYPAPVDDTLRPLLEQQKKWTEER